jgi:hypothetical protein
MASSVEAGLLLNFGIRAAQIRATPSIDLTAPAGRRTGSRSRTGGITPSIESRCHFAEETQRLALL